MTRTLCVLLCASALVGAQTPPRDAGPAVAAPSGRGGISGVVRDEGDQPVPRATVSIVGDGFNRAAITDAEGRFVFSNLPAGRFTIKAAKPSYPPMSYGASRPFRPGAGILLGEGQQATGIVLKVARGAVVSGTVFDERGQPMPGVPVMAWEVRTSLSGERTLDFPAIGGSAVTTDDRGRYRIFGLPPGEYTVGTSWFYHGAEGEARVPTEAEIREAFRAVTEPALSAAQPAAAATGQRAAPEPVTVNYTPVFYPDSLDPLAAMTLLLKAGEQRESVDIGMQLRPMSKIEGQVIAPDNVKGGVEMILSRRNRVQALNSTTFWPPTADEHFVSSSLGPGDYTIRARVQPASGRPALWAQSDVSIVGAEPIHVTLRLEPALTVSGRVVFQSTALSPPEDLTKLRISVRGPGDAGPINSTATVNADGTFTIEGMLPGSFWLTAGAPGSGAAGSASWIVRSVAQGNRDMTDVPLEIAADDAALTITFTDQATELTGVLTDASGKPATDYFVILLPADRRYWVPGSRRIVSVRPDVKGQYVFRSLPAGEYRLAVTTDLVQRDLADENALSQLSAQSTPVTLALGEKKTFDVKLGGR